MKIAGSAALGFLLWCLPISVAGVRWDEERCSMWLKTDGSGCQASMFFSFQKMLFNYAPAAQRRVCCTDGTGCFSIEPDTPHECGTDLPDCADALRPSFHFYAPEPSGAAPQTVDLARLNETVGGLRAGAGAKPRQFFAIVHGYGGDWPKNWMFNIKDRLIALGNNVMIVRWTKGSDSAKPLSYFKAAANTRTVGAALALVMKSMQFHGKLALNASTIIGFSLGSHVSGYAGLNLPGLRRIIGLDPAGPMFQCMDRRARLDPTDARLVIAIHTHGDYFLMSGCGSLQQFGHMDIYVNGGVQQPGCKRGVPEAVTDLASLNFATLTDNINNIRGPACSHNRAPPLLIEMLDQVVNPATTPGGAGCNFTAFPCGSTDEWLTGNCFKCPDKGCPVLGYRTDLGAFENGKFFFNTLAENATTGQYCGRQLLVTLVSDVTVKGRITLKFKEGKYSSGEILFQDMYDLMVAGEEKKFVAVVPWNLTSTDSLQLVYTRNKMFFTGGPYSWSLSSVSFQSIDGKKRFTDTPIAVRDGATINIVF